MAVGEAMEALVSWFGHRPFRVRDTEDHQVAEVVELAELGHAFPYDRRSKVGRWLSSEPSDENIRVVLVEPAAGSKPAVYRVE